MNHLLFDVAGPRAVKRGRIATLSFVVLGTLVVAWALDTLSRNGKLETELWMTLVNPEFLALLLSGLAATFKVAFVSLFLSIAVGTLLAWGLLSKTAWHRILLKSWIEIFRGLPLLLLIFFIFLGGPAVGIEISTFWSLVLGIMLYNSAVVAEIFRAGIQSLPKGQSEAALAIGLREGETFRIILLPQAVRRMMPALVSQMVVLIKETSLGFVIGYTEFLRDARTAVEYLGGEYSLPVYTLVAVVYISINCTLSFIARRVEARR
ncbi:MULTISPECIES: amino acid ABC transporter permease [Agrobacterium]|jgi:glutamate transport system permease protein|uniref:amino acid ABC transporter permease n=1 Tax=Agrobacterium TaxID=357 RepID=UPI001C6E9411|nr:MULTISPECIES: amino acid ABC transporter permease [Agrobacterium]MBW9075022.1 amino acid ABC transporter permease [Agrobacterium deltaense]MCZ7889601.1 amino acid ABC transporter permease [Agrobacterium salinitolerans]UNZ54140.1 amino acid ABC transporter permease [Agrobacterium tumefaciens]